MLADCALGPVHPLLSSMLTTSQRAVSEEAKEPPDRGKGKAHDALCKRYGSAFLWGQLTYWHKQTVCLRQEQLAVGSLHLHLHLLLWCVE